MIAQMAWEKGGVNWGSVLRTADGKFRFFYCTDFPGRQEGAVLIDNSMQGKNHCVVCYAESDDGLTWRRPALNLFFQDQFPGNNIILSPTLIISKADVARILDALDAGLKSAHN